MSFGRESGGGVRMVSKDCLVTKAKNSDRLKILLFVLPRFSFSKISKKSKDVFYVLDIMYLERYLSSLLLSGTYLLFTFIVFFLFAVCV